VKSLPLKFYCNLWNTEDNPIIFYDSKVFEYYIARVHNQSGAKGFKAFIVTAVNNSDLN
jgi:hypothetical protein